MFSKKNVHCPKWLQLKFYFKKIHKISSHYSCRENLQYTKAGFANWSDVIRGFQGAAAPEFDVCTVHSISLQTRTLAPWGFIFYLLYYFSFHRKNLRPERNSQWLENKISNRLKYMQCTHYSVNICWVFLKCWFINLGGGKKEVISYLHKNCSDSTRVFSQKKQNNNNNIPSV